MGRERGIACGPRSALVGGLRARQRPPTDGARHLLNTRRRTRFGAPGAPAAQTDAGSVFGADRVKCGSAGLVPFSRDTPWTPTLCTAATRNCNSTWAGPRRMRSESTPWLRCSTPFSRRWSMISTPRLTAIPTPARSSRRARLAPIGRVAGGSAHELRNPVNVVKTSVYYLLNARQPTPAKTAEHLQRIERHVVVADGVITALSNFARLPLPNLQPFPIVTC